MALFPKQKQFVKELKSKRFRYLCYGGAVSGGKTILTAGILHTMAMDYPKTRYAIFRKNFSTLKKTSIPSFKKVVELDHANDKVIVLTNKATYSNGSEILFIEADISKDPDLDKLKGLELTAALLEEANEMDYRVFNILKTRVGRWNEIEGKTIPHFMLLTCNPADNWVKENFYTPWHEGLIKEPYYFLQAYPQDNPHNSPEYLKSLEDLPEAEYQRYVKGNWDFADDPNQLISYEWLRNCQVDKYEIKTGRTILAIDPAREGDDKTVFCYINEDCNYKFEEFSKIDTTQTGLLAIERARELKISPSDIIVDVVGVGGGVVDTMRSNRFQPVSFIGGAKAESSPSFFTFSNKRAEAYWFLREALRKADIDIVQNEKLKKDLLSIRYSVTEKEIKIESKDAIKKRLGKSPDYADALSMAMWLKFSSFQRDPVIMIL